MDIYKIGAFLIMLVYHYGLGKEAKQASSAYSIKIFYDTQLIFLWWEVGCPWKKDITGGSWLYFPPEGL